MELSLLALLLVYIFSLDILAGRIYNPRSALGGTRALQSFEVYVSVR
jgi:hypothetical protein